MKKILLILFFAITIPLAFPTSTQAATLLKRNTGYASYGYGSSSWSTFTGYLNTAFGGSGNVTSVANFDSATLSNYDAIWVDIGALSGTLSATEITKLQAAITAGQRVVLIGENSSWTTWNNSILSVVGTTFLGDVSGSSYSPILVHELTTDVTTVSMPAGGQATSGTSLFTPRVATVWGDDDNAFVLLDVNILDNTNINVSGNNQLARNIANWIAGNPTGDTTAPTITSVTSNTANGSYKEGGTINITVTFSEAVTSTGNVTVMLETGSTDRSCTFTVSNASSGTCVYTVQAGDTSADLTVNSVSGVIADQFANSMSSFTIGTNLAASKALVIDTTVPTITNVSSNKSNGTYGTGEVIDIDVTFSENVTSTGNVTVTLETGDTDRSCTFTVSNASVGTCNYTVQAEDISSDLTVSSISGSIADGALNAMTNFVPATNLGANKALVIDTIGVAISTIEATPTATSVTITWITDDLASTRVDYGLTSSYGISTSETDTSPRVTNHTATISNLKACARYYYRVRSVDGSSNITNSSQQVFTTTGCTASEVTAGNESTITTASGGTVTYTNGSTTTSLTVPSGFAGQNATFQLNKLNTNTVPSMSSGVSLAGDNYYDLIAVGADNSEITSFNAPIEFTINYDSSLESTYEESTLEVYKYDGASWIDQNCTLDTVSNSLTCSLSSFSLYAVLGETTSSTTPASSSNTSSSSGGVSNTQQCTESSPSAVPDLFQIDASKTTATLYFTPITDLSKYYISYTTEVSVEQHGVVADLSSDGVQNYTINDLLPNTTYYFKVRSQNGCMPGNWGNTMTVKTSNASSEKTSFYKNFASRIISVISKKGIDSRSDSSVLSVKKSQAKSCKEYVVKSGDSLWEIAAKMLGSGAAYSSIVSSNKLNSNVLKPGQKIKVGC